MIRKLIIVNVMVFLLASLVSLVLWGMHRDDYREGFSYFTSFFSVPSNPSVLITRPWTMITYIFFHVDFFHLLFNMLFLYWLGNIFREYLGNTKTLSTYIWGGLFGAALFIICFNFIPALRDSFMYGSPLIGASAGVLALVVGAATLLPYYEVAVFSFFIPLRWIAVGVVVLDLISIPKGNAGGHIAHLGGALFGFLYVRQMRKKSVFSDSVDSFSSFIGSIFKSRKKTRLKVVKKDTTIYTNTSSFTTEFDLDDEPSQEVIDAILDKINQSGYESLTRKERDLLFKASKQD